MNRTLQLLATLKAKFRSILMFATLAGLVVTSACAVRGGYRVYDPYYGDRHRWDHREDAYYERWAREHHRESHREFRKLNRDEQKEYWNWRHAHSDRHE
jgi:hypothetical protein